MQRPWVLLALLAGGCTWLGRGQLDERLDELDEDKDGISIAGGDCAPLDPNRSPELDEIPYDRIDNDCDPLGVDVIDVDQDSFPGISQADYEALPGDLPFPEAYVGKDLDCDDTNKAVQPDPDRSSEIYYDGVDGDCQRDNDFDADRDGYHPNRVDGVAGEVEDLLAAYVEAYGLEAEAGSWGPGGAGAALPDDCDDARDEVNPGVTTDGWYDGSDDNCDDHNDFDQDGDGFMLPEWSQEYEIYVDRYYGDDPPPFFVDPDPFRDCADAPFGPLATIDDAAAVHPGATETPYDGIDSDCAGDNDYDVDVDGWLPDGEGSPTTLEAMRAYAVTWNLQGNVAAWAMGNGAEPGEGDCDDADPLTHPGALEILDDAADFDCNQNPDLADWGFEGDASVFTWIRPTNPELVRLEDEYLLLVTAEQANLSGANSADQGTTLRFPLTSAMGGGPPATPYTFGTWKGAGQILKVKRRLDVALTPDPVDRDSPPDGTPDPEVFTVVPSFGNSNFSYLYVGSVFASSTTGNLGTRNTYAQFDGLLPALYTYTAAGVDLTVDPDGEPFAAACAMENGVGDPAEVVHGLWSLGFPALDGYLETGGDTCFFTSAPRSVQGTMTATMRVCPSGVDCADVAIEEGPGFADVPGSTGEQWLYGDNDDGWIALIDATRRGWVRDASGTYPDFPVLAGGALPTSILKDPSGIGSTIDVSVSGTDVYVAAILANNEVWLQYGNPASPGFLDLELTPPAGTGDPTGVAVFADADRIAVAVSTTSATGQGSVGWMFLGPP